jgi:hypothetical protein
LREKTSEDAKPTDTAKPAATPADPVKATPSRAWKVLPDSVATECKELSQVIDKVIACDKVPAATRDGLRNTWVAMFVSLSQWNTLSEDSKKTVIKSCTTTANTLEMFEKECP